VHDIWAAIVAAMTSWHEGKLFLEHAIDLGHDSLHVIVGLLLWLLIGIVTRRPLSAGGPWLWVFAIILWNEAVDLWTERWPHPGQQYGEGAKDLLLTMLMPTILLVAIRLQPKLFRRQPRAGRARP
jgi:hypothetical protein